ncbi:MAG: cytochrome c peroxidase [Bacteroidota bacterium]
MKKLLLPTILGISVLIWAAIPSIPTAKGTMNDTEHAMSQLLPLLPSSPYNYSRIRIPQHIGGDSTGFFEYNPPTNTLTDEGATLGRVLFYDTELSINSQVSCASCHDAAFGFSDSARFSHGINNQLTDRNSIGLANARFQPLQAFFWSGDEDTLKHQVKTAITSSKEMGMHLDTLVQRLQTIGYYPGLFTDAFGDPAITSDRVFSALGQFVRSFISRNSKFDIAAETNFQQSGTEAFFFFFPTIDSFPSFSQSENRGYRLFIQSGCINCHATGNFVSLFHSNNGLDLVNTDLGLGASTGLAWDEGKFRAPSLRNIELTGPFMHDGRFNTLEEVIDHYSTGIQNNPNLAPELIDSNTGLPRKFNFTQTEKEDLISFLKTLTDTWFLDDPRYEDPFKVGQVRTIPVSPMSSLLPDDTTVVLSQTPVFTELEAIAFPNPFMDEVSIAFQNEKKEPYEIRLLNISGKVIQSKTTRNDMASFSRKDLPKGVYIIQAKGPSKLKSILVEAE